MTAERRRAERRGRRGEGLAAWYLRLKGWRVIARRVQTPRGEVDIVARRGRTLAFVEVKWRKHAAEVGHAVDAYRLRRVVAGAEVLAARYSRPGDTVRIDVVLVAPGCWPRHISNAATA